MNAIRREELHPRAGVVEAVDLPRHHLLVLVLLVFVPVPLLTLGGLAMPFPELAQRAFAPFLPFVERSAAPQPARTLAILPTLAETAHTSANRVGTSSAPPARSQPPAFKTVRVRPQVKPEVQLAMSSDAAAGVATIDRSAAGSGNGGVSHGSPPSAPDSGAPHAGSGTETGGEGSSSSGTRARAPAADPGRAEPRRGATRAAAAPVARAVARALAVAPARAVARAPAVAPVARAVARAQAVAPARAAALDPAALGRAALDPAALGRAVLDPAAPDRAERAAVATETETAMATAGVIQSSRLRLPRHPLHLPLPRRWLRHRPRLLLRSPAADRATAAATDPARAAATARAAETARAPARKRLRHWIRPRKGQAVAVDAPWTRLTDRRPFGGRNAGAFGRTLTGTQTTYPRA